MNSKLQTYLNTNLHIKQLPVGTTNAEWQELFKHLKLSVRCEPGTKMKVRQPIGTGTYYGETQDFRYKCFINSVLKTIRNLEIDYCFFVYQIIELLKHEPNLQADWDDDNKFFTVYI